MKKSSISSIDKIFIIANYFDCFVDYLLGRTDESQILAGHSIRTGDITGDNNANINTTKERSYSDTLELFEIISNLSIIDRAKLVLFIDELKNK